MIKCLHERLQFASGGFYVLCANCGCRWAAEVDTTTGTKPDYDRVDARLDFRHERVAVGTSGGKSSGPTRPATSRLGGTDVAPADLGLAFPGDDT